MNFDLWDVLDLHLDCQNDYMRESIHICLWNSISNTNLGDLLWNHMASFRRQLGNELKNEKL